MVKLNTKGILDNWLSSASQASEIEQELLWSWPRLYLLVHSLPWRWDQFDKSKLNDLFHLFINIKIEHKTDSTN